MWGLLGRGLLGSFPRSRGSVRRVRGKGGSDCSEYRGGWEPGRPGGWWGQEYGGYAWDLSLALGEPGPPGSVPIPPPASVSPRALTRGAGGPSGRPRRPARSHLRRRRPMEAAPGAGRGGGRGGAAQVPAPPRDRPLQSAPAQPSRRPGARGRCGDAPGTGRAWLQLRGGLLGSPSPAWWGPGCRQELPAKGRDRPPPRAQ